MSIVLRRFSPTDADKCYEVFYCAVHQGASEHYSAAQRKAWVSNDVASATWLQKLCRQVCWVAEVNREIVGFMTLESDGHLDLAFVLPAFRRTKVAPALYLKIEKDAQSLELARIFTEASHYARPFFLKQGWEITKPETILREGVEIERFQMAKDL